MEKLIFKRKKGGGGSNWGEGMDYLLKEYWEELDKLIEDNYHRKHDKKLVSFLYNNIFEVLDNAMRDMKRGCKKNSDSSGLNDWIKKIKNIISFGKKANSLSKKIVFIDSATQFLRESSIKKKRSPVRFFSKKVLKPKNLVVIKGVSAFKFNKTIKGIAKIVLGYKDFSKFKKNNILVTNETDPTYLPLMQVAKGFITDNGGVLCHAAITARELKKPCITGVKFATSYIKDGDEIEINSQNGFVKIL